MFEQNILLQEVKEDYAISHKVKTSPIGETQGVWAFLFIFSGILSWISIQQNLPIGVSYTAIGFLLYTVYILSTYRSFFLIDPKNSVIEYYGKVAFLREKVITITTFRDIIAIISISQNEGYRNYLAVVYSAHKYSVQNQKQLENLIAHHYLKNNICIKKIHNEDNVADIYERSRILSQIIGCPCYQDTQKIASIVSNYQLNSFEKQFGCATVCILCFVFVVVVFLCYLFSR